GVRAAAGPRRRRRRGRQRVLRGPRLGHRHPPGADRAPVRAVRHHQAGWSRPRALDLADDRRGAWRPPLGGEQHRRRRDLALPPPSPPPPAAHGPAIARRAERSMSAPRRATVAIVDDDPSVRVSLRRLCEAFGLSATAYASGRELLAS